MLNACKDDVAPIKPTRADSIATTAWKELLTESPTRWDKHFTDIALQGDTLKGVAQGLYYMLDKNGKRITDYHAQIINGRVSVDHKSAFAPKHNMVAFGDIVNDVLRISEAKIVLDHSQRKGISLYLAQKYNYPSMLQLNDYKGLNIGLECGAFNDNAHFITSVVKENTNKVVLLKLVLAEKKTYDRIYIAHAEIVALAAQEIILPENLNDVQRIQSFGTNFFISTQNNSYLIREDGSYSLVIPTVVKEFFAFQGKLYADTEKAMYQSTNNGETWQQTNTLNYKEFRSFFIAKNKLYFHKDDSLFVVNTNDFSYKALNNNGLTDKKIMGALQFGDNVFVATFGGLFIKPAVLLD